LKSSRIHTLLSYSDPLQSPAYRTGWTVLIAATAVILLALAFEYVGHYEPCALCLEQRYAYYFAMPMLFGALVLVAAQRNGLAALLFLAVALGFLINAGLGVYHAGVEWKYWAGPDTCAATPKSLSTGTGGLLKQLEKIRVARCDEATWSFIGLSFAGWNVVISLLLAAGATVSAIKALRPQ
jgi:disulfide bond formation protein DsbB